MWWYDYIDSRIESKSISPETLRRESREKLGSCKLDYKIINKPNSIFLDKPAEKLSLAIYEKQYANKDDLGISRIALDLRDSTANFTPMLEQLEFEVINLALERLNKKNPVILIDIFEHEKGGLPKLSSTHTVCLWKQQDDKLLIIDPSNADYSSFLKGLIQKQASDSDLKINIYNVDKKNKKFYQSDLLGPLKDELSRDCIDIAVKIGLQIQENLSNNLGVKTVESNISNLSNQPALNKTVKELGNDGIIVRALQSTDSKVREDTRKLLKDNAPILKYVKFSTIKQAKDFVEQLQLPTFSTEVKEELEKLKAQSDEVKNNVFVSFETGDLFDYKKLNPAIAEQERNLKLLEQEKENIISVELERIKALNPKKDYIELFKELDKELKETKMKFSNIAEYNSFLNFRNRIKGIQEEIDDDPLLSRINLVPLRRIHKDTLEKSQRKILDEVLGNKIYLDSENCTELHIASKDNDSASVNKILAKWNKDHKSIARNLVALKDIYGQTALHWAAGKGNKDICEVLVDNMGLDDIVTKASGRYNYTALHMAVKADNLDIVDLILQKSKDIINLTDESGQTALHWAAGKGNKDICKVLIANMEPKDIATQAAGSYTALHMAVKADNLDIVGLILQKSKDIINLTDESGQTALHWAASKGNKDICEVLVNLDKNILDIPDKRGRTPLIYTIQNENKAIMQMFLDLKDPKFKVKHKNFYDGQFEIVTSRVKGQYNFDSDKVIQALDSDIDGASRQQLIERDILPRNNTGAMIRGEHEELLLEGNKDKLDTSDEDQNIDITLVSADSDDPDSTGVMGDTST
ncbi:MAG TPA: ankyrin repeat domain-containing protein [Candidatus Megaira endosymbiont of Nemacystus decipiens]|nr:ankyrin repeat domain-containing protein [Candidatus Megaera endosymbiont of Nemacystus decipiens]